MQRRVWLTRLAAGALTPALWSGCGLAPGGTLPGMAGADALVRRPAQQLALVLADLPAGFRFGEEMAPALSTPSAPGGPGGPLGANPGAALPDPWGRLSAYSVTYLAAPAAPLAAGSADARAPTPAVGDVVSSVNAYVGVNEATAAFESWQASIPPVYRRLEQPPPGAPPGAAVYVQSPRTACLIGFRAHNVLASIWIGPAPAPPNAPADAVVALAVRFAGLVAHRIESVAGR